MRFKEDVNKKIWVKVLNDYSDEAKIVCYILFMNADCVRKEYYGKWSWMSAEINVRSYAQMRHKLDKLGVTYIIED